MLRFDPPVPITGRTCQSEVDIAGHRIPRDTVVLTMLATANRDPDVYPDPGHLRHHPRPRPSASIRGFLELPVAA